MVKKNSPKKSKPEEPKEPDLRTQVWMSRPPDRSEKNAFANYFNRLKKGMITCDLNRENHIFNRFKIILG